MSATVKRGTRAPDATGTKWFNPYPRYLQIRNILLGRLADGAVPGDRFPTEHELCREFGVSRETVREALSGLESEGYIARHRGRGTVVVRRPERARDERLTGLVEDFTDLGLDTHVTVLRSDEAPAPADVCARLGLPAGARLHRIERLRFVDGTPFALHDAWLPPEIATRIAGRDLGHTTLFGELRRVPRLAPVELYQHVDVDVADLGTAKRLGTVVGAPLLVTRRALAHRGAGHPTMYFVSTFRSDRYYYTVQVDRRGATARATAPPAPARRRASTGGAAR
jgi:GntR family transcriptional regulator